MGQCVYISGPLTNIERNGSVARNIYEAIHVADLLMEAGHHPYIPHLFYIWECFSPQAGKYEKWIETDFEWVKRCDVMVRLPGSSSGADREVALAESLGIPVLYSINPLLEGNV